MSYVQSHLLPGESVLVYTHPFPSAFARPALLIVIGVALALLDAPLFAALCSGAGLIYLVAEYIGWRCTEYAITTHRVVARHGIIRRRTYEIATSQVEGVRTSRSVLGMLFGYGTVTITGAGRSWVRMANVPHAGAMLASLRTPGTPG